MELEALATRGVDPLLETFYEEPTLKQLDCSQVVQMRSVQRAEFSKN